MSVTHIPDSPTEENHHLSERNLALALALREERQRSETQMAAYQRDLSVLCQDLQELEQEKGQLTQSLARAGSRVQELEAELRSTREQASRKKASPPPLPPLTPVDRMLIKAMKRTILGRGEEALEIFATLAGHSPSFAQFYQKVFQSWAMVGSSMEGSRFARQLAFSLRGNAHKRFLRAYCEALDELAGQANTSATMRRRWLLELAELNADQPARAIGYLRKARQAS